MSAYSDEQLVLEALDDSDLAFGQLVKQYQYRVMRTIASIITNEQAAHDVAQETFLSAWSNLQKLKEKQKFGRWLNQIAINSARLWLRDQQRYQEHTASFRDMTSLTQEQSYQQRKLRQEVWDAIDELSEEHREVIILHYISGYSYEEMGEMLSIPTSTIVGRLQKARNQLRKEFMDMVTKLQLEIDSTVHKFLKEHAKQDGLSVEGLIIRLIERYRRDVDASGVVTRLVRDNAQGFMGAISPDGRYISYVNCRTSSNLAIYDLQTGEDRDVTDEASPGKDRQFARRSVWSPDGKQIAYLWSGPRVSSLRIVGTDGSKPRVLYSSPSKSEFLSPQTWSRDGKHILAFRHKKTDETHDHDFVLVSVADGSVRVLKSLDGCPFGDFGHRLSLSPDGHYVVYDSPQSEDSANRDILMLATDGSYETTLVEHPADDYAPLWTPDGNGIVFISERSGSKGVWFLEVFDGKPKGSPQLVKENLNGINPLGMTQDGSYYYGLTPGDGDVYVATLDPKTGMIVTPPAKAAQSFEGFNCEPAFSPDGEYLAYVSKRPRGTGYLRIMVILSLETGEERIFSPEHIGIDHFPCWSPDGRSILIFAIGRTDALDIYQIDTETGAAIPVVLSDEQGKILLVPFVLSSDGNRIFFMRRIDGTKVIRAYDLETEREWEPDFQLACGEEYARTLALSPDGQQLAFMTICDNEWWLRVAPSTGGEARKVRRLLKGIAPQDGAAPFAWLAWTLDVRYLIFAKQKDEAYELWRIPVEDGEPQNLGSIMNHIHLSFHPDGRRIAFSGRGSGGGNAWAMENFLP